jgi:hypothetical protein
MTGRNLAAAAAIAAALICVAHAARAQTTAELTLKPWADGQVGETVDKLLYQEQGHVKREDDSRGAQVFWWDSTGRFRFDKHDPDAFALAYRILAINFDTNSPSLPDTLDEISLAAGLHLGEMAGFRSSLVIGAGYSGDNLFATEDGLFGIGHLLFERKTGDRDSLVIGIGYDGSSALFPDVPYAEFALVHRGDERAGDPLTYSIGYPHSSLRWLVAPDLSVEANYTVPYSGDVTIDYALGHGVSVFGNFTNFFNAFFQEDFSRTDRLFYEMRRAEVGIRYRNPDVFRGIALDAALVVGYAFDQQFSRGHDVRDRDPFAEISDEPYIGLVLVGQY